MARTTPGADVAADSDFDSDDAAAVVIVSNRKGAARRGRSGGGGGGGRRVRGTREGNEEPGRAGDGGGGASTGAGAGACAGAGLRGWMVRARGLGLSLGEMVLELHVRQGVPLLSVAGALGMGAEEVAGLWEEARGLLAKRALMSEVEMGGLRERIGMTLWQTVETTFPVVGLGDDAEVADGSAAMEMPGPPSAPMLSVRLKALDQLTKLYDLNLSRGAEEGEVVPYAAPAEIAAAVRERVLGMWRRDGGTVGG